MPRWILASSNAHKVKELEAIFASLGVPVELVLLPKDVVLPEETGTTFLANARLKARAAAKATGQPALADDSGLEVDALGGDPGVRSARYAGEDATDADNNAKLLAELDGIHGPNRHARFRCTLVLAGPGGDEVSADGAIEGRIRESASGANGFGYDPLFEPDGDTRSLAEYAQSAKNAVSHRGRAARRLVEALVRLGRLEPGTPALP